MAGTTCQPPGHAGTSGKPLAALTSAHAATVGNGSRGTRYPQRSMRDVRPSTVKTYGLPLARGSCWIPGSWMC